MFFLYYRIALGVVKYKMQYIGRAIKTNFRSIILLGRLSDKNVQSLSLLDIFENRSFQCLDSKELSTIESYKYFSRSILHWWLRSLAVCTWTIG